MRRVLYSVTARLYPQNASFHASWWGFRSLSMNPGDEIERRRRRRRRRRRLHESRSQKRHNDTPHFHQNTRYDPSALNNLRVLVSAPPTPPTRNCFLPNGSVRSNDNFSEMGPISTLETRIGGLSVLGSDCSSEKMLVFARPTIRWWMSRRWSYSGQRISR